MSTKCVVKRTCVGFRQEAVDRIQCQMATAKENETDAIHSLITEGTFGPNAEEYIAQQMATTGKRRQQVLEDVILWAREQRALSRKPSRPGQKQGSALPHSKTPPGQPVPPASSSGADAKSLQENEEFASEVRNAQGRAKWPSSGKQRR